MTDLTDDERTVLMIAAGGQSMMAIGRWEKSVDYLVTKGLMHRADKFNNFITPVGRAIIEQSEDAVMTQSATQMIETGVKVRNARTQAQMSVEQAAQHLAIAARASVEVTGGTVEDAAREWSQVVLERALELVK